MVGVLLRLCRVSQKEPGLIRQCVRRLDSVVCWTLFASTWHFGDLGTMLNQFLQTVVKALFTGILLVVVALCVIEIWRLWFDRTLVLATFGYTQDGRPSREAGQHFTQMVSQDLNRLRDIYTGRLRSGDLHIPSTDQIGRGQDVQVPVLQESVLTSVEIQAYGIQVSNLLKTLSRWIERPHAIAGNVSESSKGIDVYAELRNGSAGVTVETGQGRWYISQMADVHEASFALSCRIFRLLLASQSSYYAQVSDAEFCAFARAQQSYQLYRERVAEIAGEEEAKDALAEADRIVSELSNRSSQFPFVYKLAGHVSLARGDLEKADAAFTQYLDLLDKHGETDRETANFLLELRGEQPPGEAEVVKTAEDLGLRSRIRPVQPGTSVSVIGRETAGTICCVVRDATGMQYLVSADHTFQGSAGTAIIQPGGHDGGGDSDQIAMLARTIEIHPGQANRAAGAVSRLIQGVEVSPEIPGIGRIQGIATDIQPGDSVRVVGRTSGLAEGTVTGIKVVSRINTPEPVLFEGLIETNKISGPGDSGAPVLTMDNELVGMVYAGSSEFTLVMPIEPILQALDVELVQ